MEIKIIFVGIMLSLVLVACGGNDMITGNTIQEIISEEEQQIQDLKAQVKSLQQQVATYEAKDVTASAKDLLIQECEEDLAAQIKTNKQQRQVLVELDDECGENRETAETCEEDIEELEEKNDKLQDMLDICQEDLS